ncbi:hypothetical protein ACFFSY_29535 [Paenibacillus aurantiacus]|uniref:DUF4760 domain-containing protein n=1 Tax=Paenibacillus aurantiacus TaxID=1936118 RepID=A0ABV5KY08_9BACL
MSLFDWRFTFDLGGFSGGIIGALFAWLVAWWTIKNQNKKEVPTINKKRYELIIKIQIILRDGLNDICTVELDLGRENLVNLNDKGWNVYNNVRHLLPEAIETDVIIHDRFVSFSDELLKLILKFADHIKDKESAANQEYCKEFAEAFRNLALQMSHDGGRTISQIRTVMANKKPWWKRVKK